MAKTGRPVIPIEWDKVEKLLIAGCSGQEIASHFAIHPDTLYDRVVKEFGKSYSEYSHEFKQKGDSLLRAKQFEKAMEKDNTMLIWLGKNRLKQKESPKEDEEMNLQKLLHLLIQGGVIQQ